MSAFICWILSLLGALDAVYGKKKVQKSHDLIIQAIKQKCLDKLKQKRKRERARARERVEAENYDTGL